MISYPSRRSTRLRNYDYAQAGAYFVTLCIQNRLPLLGEIVDGQMRLSPAGSMVATIWGNRDRYYPVEVDAFVVMPNYVHGILVLGGAVHSGGHGEDRDRATAFTRAAKADRDGATVPTTPATPQGGISLSTVIQRFKSFTMHEYGTGVAQEGWPRYPRRLWLHRFYDHVIRNERDLAAIRAYIANNPMQWQLDRENPDRVR